MSLISPVGDSVTSALETALTGISTRQKVIADNIANASTPGYRARAVSFESSLSSALSSGDPSSALISVTDANTPVKQDGNSVDMTTEVTQLNEAGLMYDALVSAMNFKLTAARSALSR